MAERANKQDKPAKTTAKNPFSRLILLLNVSVEHTTTASVLPVVQGYTKVHHHHLPLVSRFIKSCVLALQKNILVKCLSSTFMRRSEH